jgi:hypothetical protein
MGRRRVPPARPRRHALSCAAPPALLRTRRLALEVQSWYQEQLERQPVLYIETTALAGKLRRGAAACGMHAPGRGRGASKRRRLPPG